MPFQFEWRRSEEEADEILFRNVRKHGCHIVSLPDGERGPGYALSIGLFANYCHAELVVFGLHPDDLAFIFVGFAFLSLAAVAFGAVIATLAESTKPSFVVLTSKSEERRRLALRRDQNNWFT